MNDLDLIRFLGTEVSIVDEVSKQRARTRLQMVIENEAASTGRRTPATSGWRRVSVGASVAAGIVIVLVLAVLLPQGSGSYASATELLNEMSRVAERQSWELLAEGEYLYSSSDQVVRIEEAGQAELRRDTRESWIGLNGSGRIVNRSGDVTFGAGELIVLDTAELSTDPEELLDELRDGEVLGGAPASDVDLLSDIGTLLSETNASPEIRSALFRAAGRLHGVEIVGEVVDPTGRPGQAVSLTEGSKQTELIVDTENSQLLSRSEWVVGDGVRELMSQATYLASGIVDSVEDRPSSS